MTWRSPRFWLYWFLYTRERALPALKYLEQHKVKLPPANNAEGDK